MAGRDKPTLRFAARGLGDGWPQVVKARLDQARPEFEEVELGGRLPVRFMVSHPAGVRARYDAVDPVVALGGFAIGGELKRIAVFVAAAGALVVDDVDAAVGAFDHQIERGLEYDRRGKQLRIWCVAPGPKREQFQLAWRHAAATGASAALGRRAHRCRGRAERNTERKLASDARTVLSHRARIRAGQKARDAARGARARFGVFIQPLAAERL